MDTNDEFLKINVKIEKERRQKKYFTLLLTLALVSAALMFLYYSYGKFEEANNKIVVADKKTKEANALVDSTKKALIILKKEYDSVQVIHSKKIKIFETLANQFKAFHWKPEDLGIVDSIVIDEARKANAEITNILAKDSSYLDYYNKKIRYYIKKADSGKIINALNRTPFSNKYNPNGSYYKIGTNRIIAHKSVDIKYIKFITLILLQEGVNVKEVRYFKKDDPLKKNFIEISADEYIVDKPILNFEDIMSLTIDDL